MDKNPPLGRVISITEQCFDLENVRSKKLLVSVTFTELDPDGGDHPEPRPDKQQDGFEHDPNQQAEWMEPGPHPPGPPYMPNQSQPVQPHHEQPQPGRQGQQGQQPNGRNDGCQDWPNQHQGHQGNQGQQPNQNQPEQKGNIKMPASARDEIVCSCDKNICDESYLTSANGRPLCGISPLPDPCDDYGLGGKEAYKDWNRHVDNRRDSNRNDYGERHGNRQNVGYTHNGMQRPRNLSLGASNRTANSPDVQYIPFIPYLIPPDADSGKPTPQPVGNEMHKSTKTRRKQRPRSSSPPKRVYVDDMQAVSAQKCPFPEHNIDYKPTPVPTICEGNGTGIAELYDPLGYSFNCTNCQYIPISQAEQATGVVQKLASILIWFFRPDCEMYNPNN